MNALLNKRQKQLTAIFIACVSIFVIQAKTFIYHSHDCLFLNPGNSSAISHAAHEHHSPKVASRIEGVEHSRHIHKQDIVVSVADVNSKHNHNECSICQSFQYLISYLHEAPQKFPFAQNSLHETLHVPFSRLYLASILFLDAGPRAPPLVT